MDGWKVMERKSSVRELSHVSRNGRQARGRVIYVCAKPTKRAREDSR